MKWFRRHRNGGQGENGQELVDLQETQTQQLEEWDAVKHKVNGTRPAEDREALADYERAEQQRLGEDGRIG